LSISFQKYGFGIRDPRYGIGIRKKPILDPGSRVQKGTGSRIRIRNTEYDGEVFPGWLNALLKFRNASWKRYFYDFYK
jgi:hypothetical protein